METIGRMLEVQSSKCFFRNSAEVSVTATGVGDQIL